MKRLCLVVLVLCLSADWASAAGRVFYDGFESGSVNAAWRDDAGSPFCPVVSTATDGVTGAYAGTKMIKCGHRASEDFDNIVLDTDNYYTDELFIRVKVRVDENMDRTVSSSKKLLRFFYWDSVNLKYHDLYEIVRLTNGLNNESHSEYNVTENTYWGDATGDNTALTSGWHEVEYYIRQTGGLMKVWHDGVLVRNESGLNYVGILWAPFFITSNFSDSHDTANDVYFDEFEVYSDTGTGATGTMAAGDIVQGGGGSTAGGGLDF